MWRLRQIWAGSTTTLNPSDRASTSPPPASATRVGPVFQRASHPRAHRTNPLMPMVRKLSATQHGSHRESIAYRAIRRGEMPCAAGRLMALSTMLSSMMRGATTLAFHRLLRKRHLFARHRWLRNMLCAMALRPMARSCLTLRYPRLRATGPVENADGRLRRWLPREPQIDPTPDAEIAPIFNVTPRICRARRPSVEAVPTEPGKNIKLCIARGRWCAIRRNPRWRGDIIGISVEEGCSSSELGARGGGAIGRWPRGNGAAGGRQGEAGASERAGETRDDSKSSAIRAGQLRSGPSTSAS